MSYEIGENLGSAKDALNELKSAYDDIKNYGSYGWDRKITEFTSAQTEFLVNQIDDVYTAMDEAVDEIKRLDDENDELRERIEELEKQIEELEGK